MYILFSKLPNILFGTPQIKKTSGEINIYIYNSKQACKAFSLILFPTEYFFLESRVLSININHHSTKIFTLHKRSSNLWRNCLLHLIFTSSQIAICKSIFKGLKSFFLKASSMHFSNCWRNIINGTYIESKPKLVTLMLSSNLTSVFHKNFQKSLYNINSLSFLKKHVHYEVWSNVEINCLG